MEKISVICINKSHFLMSLDEGEYTSWSTGLNTNLVVGRGWFYPRCWFFLNNSETVKAVTLVFCSVQQHFIRDICAKFGIPNFSQSLDNDQNSDGGICDCRVSGQSLIKENCHNSRNSHDIDMKLGPVTKTHKINKTPSKEIDDDAMTENWDVMFIFAIYSPFGAIRKPDSGRIVCKTYVFINSNLFSYKNLQQN